MTAPPFQPRYVPVASFNNSIGAVPAGVGANPQAPRLPSLAPPPPVCVLPEEFNGRSGMGIGDVIGGQPNRGSQAPLSSSYAPPSPRFSSVGPPVAGSPDPLPVGSRRRRPAADSRSPSPAAARTRRAPPFTRLGPAAHPGVRQSGSSPGDAAPALELSRVYKEAVTAVRREVTATRKELAVTNSNMRALTQKTDEVAKVADQLSVGLIVQRRILVKVAADVATTLTAVTALVASRTPTIVDEPAAEATATAGADGTAPPLPDPRTQEEMETQDAKWILGLKDDLAKWLHDKFLNSTCTTDVWVTTKDVNVFLRDWTMRRFGVSAKDAVRLLESPWRLPKRPRRQSAPRANGDAPSDVAPKRLTIAYQYLHRVVSHFYQKVGAKVLSAFASHVNEELSKGTLRCLRKTTSKFEIYFTREDARWLLEGDRFLNNSVCRDGLVRGVAAVFSHFNVLHRFSESGATEGGPRILACRLAYFAVAATKVRSHLKMRASPKNTDGIQQQDGTEENDEDGSNADDDVDDSAGPPAEKVSCLNGGHRPEWVVELQTVGLVLAGQGARADKGFRVTDGNDPRRTDPTRPRPPAPASRAQVTAADGATDPARGVPAGGARPSSGSDIEGASSAWREPRETRGAPADDRRERDGVPDGSSAVRGDGSSSDGLVTCSDQDEEEPPRRRRRTATEAREAAARRRAARVLTAEFD